MADDKVKTWGVLTSDQIYGGHGSLTPLREAELGKVRMGVRCDAGVPALADAIVAHGGKCPGDTSRNALVSRLIRAEASRLGVDAAAVEAKAARALRREVRARQKK